MGLSLAQLRTEVREHLGVDSVELIDADVDLLLNRSWWKVADDFDFREKETSRSYNTVAGTSTIASATDTEGLQGVSIEDTNSKQHTSLSPMTIGVYETEYADISSTRAKPTHYVRRGSNIILFPTPDAAYEITEYYLKTLADIASTGPTIPQSWHEIIMYGAVYRGFARIGDYNRSRAARTMQVELMSTQETVDTTEKVDRPTAGLQMIRPRYP